MLALGEKVEKLSKYLQCNSTINTIRQYLIPNDL